MHAGVQMPSLAMLHHNCVIIPSPDAVMMCQSELQDAKLHAVQRNIGCGAATSAIVLML